ncbi:MAG: type II secretion system protein M [Comamonadaceae bacterium]|nr:MAG: type II secretion system protein M [Comamonadaceae bacterium]
MNRPTSSLSAQIAPLQARWKALARREQTMVLAAGFLIGLALLWWVFIAPALQTLRTAPARHAELDAQLQRMHAMQAEAMQLKAAPRARSADAVRTLQSGLTQRLGPSAQMATTSDRATLTLKAAPADRLADWMSQARSTAHAVPVEMRLVRSAATPPAGNPKPAAGAAPEGVPRWDGTVVLALPPQ